MIFPTISPSLLCGRKPVPGLNCSCWYSVVTRDFGKEMEVVNVQWFTSTFFPQVLWNWSAGADACQYGTKKPELDGKYIKGIDKEQVDTDKPYHATDEHGKASGTRTHDYQNRSYPGQNGQDKRCSCRPQASTICWIGSDRVEGSDSAQDTYCTSDDSQDDGNTSHAFHLSLCKYVCNSAYRMARVLAESKRRNIPLAVFIRTVSA